MSTAKFDTLSNLAGTQTVPVATVAQGSAKAWVNFNGTGTVAIRAAFNVSSITDNGTGNYTVNFTTAMPDADYSSNINSDRGSSGNSRYNNLGTISSSSLQLFTRTDTIPAGEDMEFIRVSIFR
jgi:hypothetical protein